MHQSLYHLSGPNKNVSGMGSPERPLAEYFVEAARPAALVAGAGVNDIAAEQTHVNVSSSNPAVASVGKTAEAVGRYDTSALEIGLVDGTNSSDTRENSSQGVTSDELSRTNPHVGQVGQDNRNQQVDFKPEVTPRMAYRPNFDYAEFPTEKSAGMFDSIRAYASQNPETTADVLTAAGMTGLGALMSGISGAVEAPSGYRLEAASRDALLGGLGGLSSFAALKGTQKFFNEGATSNPVAAAAAGLGGYAFSKAISDARYPILLSLMGRPSWEVLPGEVTQTVRAELRKMKAREERRAGKLQAVKRAASKLRGSFQIAADPGRSGSRTWYNLLLQGKPVGYMQTEPAPGQGVRVNNIQLLETLRGFGLGRKALGEVMRQTGQPLLSGWQVSPWAQKMLQRMGAVPGRTLTQLTSNFRRGSKMQQPTAESLRQIDAPSGVDVFKLTQKQAEDSDLSTLRQAKSHSDQKHYKSKHALLRTMMLRRPNDWLVDNPTGREYGITHIPSGWRFHLPVRVIPVEVLSPVQKQADVQVAGGSSPERWAARTVGRVLGLPAAVLIGHESAPTWLAEEDQLEHARMARLMHSQFPQLKGTAVRLGGTNTLDDVKRIWADKQMSPLTRAVLAGMTTHSNVMSNLQRSSHYNPITDTATVYGNLPQITAHELGHAADFKDKGQWTFPYLMSRMPEQMLGLSSGPMTHWMEVAANRNVHKALKTHPRAEEEIATAWRRLAPAYGTYGAGTLAGGLLLHHQYAKDKQNTPLAKLVQTTQGWLGKHMPQDTAAKLTPLVLSLGIAGGGALVGRGAAEVRNASAAVRRWLSSKTSKKLDKEDSINVNQK